MRDPCPDIEELGEILELPRTEPRRQHVETCWRCQRIVESYQEFLAASEPPSRSETETARAQLREAWVVSLRPDRTSAGTRPVRSPSRGHWRVWQAAAAVAITAGALLFMLDLGPEDHGRPVERGAPMSGYRAKSWAPRLESVPSVEAGSVRLRWSASLGAVRYEVHLLDEDGREIARLAPSLDTTRVLSRAEVPRALGPGATILWKVVAFDASADSTASLVSELHFP